MVEFIKMNLHKLGFGFLCFLSLCNGCITVPNSRIETFSPNPTLPEGHYDHFSPRWKIADQPSLKGDHLSIAIYGINVAGYGTVLIYSAAGSEVDELTKTGSIVQIRDDQDRISELVSIEIAATVKNLQLGVMRFEPRQIGANELFLHVRRASDGKVLVDMVVAWFMNPPEEPSGMGASYLVSNTQVFEQAGHQITFLGWIPPQPPILPTPTVPNLPKGVLILENATLRIEEIEGNRVYQLHLRFLSNGEINSELNEYLKLPTQTPP